MKFGAIPVDGAAGSILAHGVRSGDVNLSKGHVLDAADIEALKQSGVTEVVAALLDGGDVAEDDAAQRIGRAMQGSGIVARSPSTGRVNLHAEHAGVFKVEADLVNALNGVDPAITLATLRNHASVASGQMVATVKIIPFAVANGLVEAAEAVCKGGTIMSVSAFKPHKVGLIQTTLGRTQEKVLDKTGRVTAARLARSESVIEREVRCDHDVVSLSGAVTELAVESDLVIVFGASATSDAWDVIPAAIGLAGGDVIRVGMPVDPGNLITLGTFGGKTIIGAPGCARSPKKNGFDWVLDRIIAGIPVESADIEAMGVGGLLSEIPARPRPREAPDGAVRLNLGAVLLAAGRSSRMGGPNKLLATFDGVPLVRCSAATIVDAGLNDPVVVTGHQKDRIEAALSGLAVHFSHNAEFADGLSSSLKTGMHALPDNADGVLIMLADMPGVSVDDIKRLADAFRASGGGSIIRATHSGKRGNPVILPKSVFASVDAIEGDTGARQIVESGNTPVIDVEIGAAASLDVDTPELLRRAGGIVVSEDS